MLKLGTETGSLSNHVLSRAVIGQPEPVEGMGVTILCWTDREPGTIINVTKIGATVIYVREDHARRTDKNGMSECQTWEFQPNPAGALYTFRQRKDGTWAQVVVNHKTGRLNKVDGGGHGLRIGERGKYHDFSF